MSILFEIIKSIIYGIVQGITEWLPISSTGHLILLNKFMPLTLYGDAAQDLAFWEMYKVVIQFGSILAVVLLYFERLNPFSSKKDDKEKHRTWRLWFLIVVATIPAGLAGVLLEDIVDARLSTPIVIAIALIVYGVLFMVLDKPDSQARIKSLNNMDIMTALKIGCFQALALIPGTSRSGSTILGSTLVGCQRPVATEFAFFMAIPVMLGASLLKIIKMDFSMGGTGILILLIGTLVSFLVSVVVIRSFLQYIRKHSFRMFGIYRIVLGIVIIALVLMGIIPNEIVG